MRFKNHRISIYLVSIMLTFAFFYSIGMGIYYYYIQEKLESYAGSILTRSDSLIAEVQLIDRLRQEFSVFSPCSDQYLHELRKRLWPYPLVKDIAYVSDEKVICSALWGIFRTPIPLNVYRNKVNRGSYTWVFDALIEENITADMLYTSNFAITVSPFAFQRFWQEAQEMNFNAIVGDFQHKNHFFHIGTNTSLLEAIEHDKVYSLFYMIKKSCNSTDNICVMAGTPVPLFFYKNLYILMLLFASSIVAGVLNGTLYINNSEKKQSLLSRLKNAIENKELHLVYQPIYKVKDLRVVGIEALLRWTDHQIGNIGPDIFIPLAEKNGLINKIGLYVVEHAIRECAPVLHRGELTLSINVNCSDICDENFRTKLLSTIKNENISGESIIIEITERQNSDIDDLKKSMAFFKNEGIQFALDDFGTGYSNLNWLSFLDVDEIKIDKSLTDSIGSESANNYILPGLIGMFNNIPKLVVFEGVETEMQYRFLVEKVPECCAQGWYFSKAVSVNELSLALSG